ncbi:hypothetical protein [Rhizobium sp. Rhizsp82]|uniref:hypothetical protein n=1 Tax=Rhizobium sp. Rhizsp82 TaxID=3243057 RepID=UPI0039B625F4
MSWEKLGQVYCPDGRQGWDLHSFMTPVPLQISDKVIRVYGGVRDQNGISRIAWIDVDRTNPMRVLQVASKPVLDVGKPGMFDDNGVILGDLVWASPQELRMYYVGFQLVQKVKFLAFTGLAISLDRGETFNRVKSTPVIDRALQAPFIAALHSIERQDSGYRAWISCGQRWQNIDGTDYPQYNCWAVDSADGIAFDMQRAVKILDVAENEYRIGRPRVNRTKAGYELRVTSDTLDKEYACFLALSHDGIRFDRTMISELPVGTKGAWDDEMTCYPARIDTPQGESYLFYNGNGMGRTGLGVARWIESNE